MFVGVLCSKSRDTCLISVRFAHYKDCIDFEYKISWFNLVKLSFTLSLNRFIKHLEDV